MSSRGTSPVPPRRGRSSGLAAIVASLPSGGASTGSAPPPSNLRGSSAGITSTPAAAISSRSAGLSVTGGALVSMEQTLFHLPEADVSGKYCCGLIQSSSGPKTCVCIKPLGACKVLAHKNSVTLMGGAYYARSRNSSVVIWPFVLHSHLGASADHRDAGIISTERSTADHLEAFHAFYDRHSNHLQEVLDLPRVKSLIGYSSRTRRVSAEGLTTIASVPVADSRSVLSSSSIAAPLDSDSVIASVSGSRQGLPDSVERMYSPGIDLDSISVGTVESWDKLEAHFNEFGNSIQGAIANVPSPDEDNSIENVLAFVTALGSKLDDFQLVAIEAIRAEKRDLDRLRQSVASIKKFLTMFTDEVNGNCSTSETYEMYGSVWDAIFSSRDMASSAVAHFSAQLDALTISTKSAASSAEEALSTAAIARARSEEISVELDVEMATVADGFTTLGATVAELQQRPSSSPPPTPSRGRLQNQLFPFGDAAGQGFGVTGTGPAVQPGSGAGGLGSNEALAALAARLDKFQARMSSQDALIAGLRSENESLKVTLKTAPFAVPSSSDASSSSFKFKRYATMTEAALRAFMDENGLKWAQVAVFTDIFSLMAHGSEAYARTSSELNDRIKSMRQNGVSDTIAVRTIVSFEQLYPIGWSISTDDLKNGEAFTMLKSKEGWVGTDGYSGTRAKYLEKVETATIRARAYIMRATAEGPLRELCLELMRGSAQFWTDFFAYVNNDLTRLIQFEIPEKDCLVLVSEQINIVFEAIYNKRQLMPQFDPHMDSGDYASQIAYYTLQAHAVMDEFSSVKFGGHGLLGNTFIRFLAKQTGNSSAVVKLEKKLDEQMKKINKKLDETVTAAKKAKG